MQLVGLLAGWTHSWYLNSFLFNWTVSSVAGQFLGLMGSLLGDYTVSSADGHFLW
jgi:hypothetical protein